MTRSNSNTLKNGRIWHYFNGRKSIGLEWLRKHEFLYKDATVYLHRKKETFDKVISITKDRKKYRKIK